jgi:hypothetical protein
VFLITVEKLVLMGVGIVIPAYKPDPSQLVSYASSLLDGVDAAVVHIELDDPTGDVDIDETSVSEDISINKESYRRGKGAAITHGFEKIKTEYLAFTDADGSTPVESVKEVVSGLSSTHVCVGSRRHPDAIIEAHQTVFRRFLGDGFAWSARRLLDVQLSDYQCGIKAITREAWQKVRTHLYEPGFAWDIELVAIAHALGYDITEIPITWHDNAGSTVNPLTTTVELGRTLLQLRFRTRSLRTDQPTHSRGTETSLVEQIDRESNQ